MRRLSKVLPTAVEVEAGLWVMASRCWLLVALVALSGVSLKASDRSDLSEAVRSVSSKVENFLLRDTGGDARELYHQTNARAVVLIFTTTGCPIVQKSIPRIKELRDEFGPKGVIF